ncbi:hypothetical protein [Varunaivibrio sulfuroxidans]|nr:hypothetical protein [Varunaivibrio sulfuroxidans]WES30533.1 hypothetical protein P3M64_12960 [Varunaivibrio sulfuroxidans]
MKKYLILALFAFGVSLTLVHVQDAKAAETIVKVQMWNDGMNMKLKLSRHSAPAGKITFQGTNTSQDGTVHEMLVVRVKNKNEKLPYDANSGRIPEDKISSLGEISETDPGKTGTLTLNLTPGLYELFCNKPGHFMAGMHEYFTVK